jgi:hypothetical protein
LQINDDVFDPTWLSGWLYRKSHLILNKTGAGTNYQMRLTLHYASGSDSGKDVYLNENCQTDFDDFRVTDDEHNLLYQWQQEVTDSNTAIYWFKVTDNLDSNNVTIYVYYGNDEASLSTDLENTMYWGDGFESGDLSRWTVQGNAYSIESSVVMHGSYSVNAAYGSGRVLSKDGLSVLSKARLCSFVRPYYSTSNPFYHYHGSGYGYLLCLRGGYFQRYVGSWQNLPTTTTYAINNWYFVEVAVDFTTDTNKYWINNAYKGEVNNQISGDDISSVAHLSGATSAYVREYIDDSFIAKWVDPEPTHSTWGEEESNIVYVIFYNQTGGVFMVDGTKYGNGSETSYMNASVIELQGIIAKNYTFDRYTYDSSEVEVNPYNLTIPSNLTIWLMIDPISVVENGENGLTSSWVISGFLLFALVFIPLIIIVIRRY